MVCLFCEIEFEPRKKWQKFCSDKCRDNYNNDKKYEAPLKCPHCKNEIQSMLEKLNHGHALCNCCSKEFTI